MPRRGGRHYVLVKGAERAMEAFKLEVAQDLGLAHLIGEEGDYHGLTTLQVGQIGGEIVRRIQAAGEWAIMQRYNQGAQRLLPEEVLPDTKRIRKVTNNGNPSPQAKMSQQNHVVDATNTGQQWPPDNNHMTQH
mgnify:CR=1 FL=1